MKKMARFATALLSAVMLLTGTGCSANSIDPSTIDYVQLRAPEEGEDIAILDTTLGEITLLLYTDEVPTIVQNFKDLVNEGFFDGQSIYQVVPTAAAAMFGSATPDGNSPDTNTGKPIQMEYSNNLWPFSGSVCVMCSEIGQMFMKKDYFDSRSFIIGSIDIADEDMLSMEQNMFPAMMMNAFEIMGGVPSISQYHTVYAKVIQGMDIVDTIMSMEYTEFEMTDEERAAAEEAGYETSYQLTEDVIINSITLDTFRAADYETLDNTLTEQEYIDLIARSEVEQAEIDAAIQDGTYGKEESEEE
ncbi:MAG: peptidylprolyl isomerase [Oscillospiraceae bacterium]|nr:peptidylprolyl isomerase [Oscillospiraceae bacterium]